MNHDKGNVIPVAFCEPKFAKTVKTFLEQHSNLNRQYRLTQAKSDKQIVGVPYLHEFEHPNILSFGELFCLYSSAKMGQQTNDQQHQQQQQQLVLDALLVSLVDKHNHVEEQPLPLLQRLQSIPSDILPRRLNVMGDDRTVVVPFRALRTENLAKHLSSVIRREALESMLETTFWKNLAAVYKSYRVVRRAPIDANSGTRQSAFEILYYSQVHYQRPGWMTITEHQIRQSFDMTKVMFSRGNLSEKRRFGTELVKENERVLDLYAGIGYFTLPALVLGKAQHVYCCEWNPDALLALRYNLSDNGVTERATILEGDCRKTVPQHDEILGTMDRVSLGLLPSSEGSWKIAVQSLNRNRGGWLHVHGNVLVNEVHQWKRWMCSVLRSYCEQMSWRVGVSHVERVKSFAPNINHYVVDVYCGPQLPKDCKEVRVEARPPSCALSKDGVLNHEWMR